MLYQRKYMLFFYAYIYLEKLNSGQYIHENHFLGGGGTRD